MAHSSPSNHADGSEHACDGRCASDRNDSGRRSNSSDHHSYYLRWRGGHPPGNQRRRERILTEGCPANRACTLLKNSRPRRNVHPGIHCGTVGDRLTTVTLLLAALRDRIRRAARRVNSALMKRRYRLGLSSGTTTCAMSTAKGVPMADVKSVALGDGCAFLCLCGSIPMAVFRRQIGRMDGGWRPVVL